MIARKFRADENSEKVCDTVCYNIVHPQQCKCHHSTHKLQLYLKEEKKDLNIKFGQSFWSDSQTNQSYRCSSTERLRWWKKSKLASYCDVKILQIQIEDVAYDQLTESTVIESRYL